MVRGKVALQLSRFVEIDDLASTLNVVYEPEVHMFNTRALFQ